MSSGIEVAALISGATVVGAGAGAFLAAGYLLHEYQRANQEYQARQAQELAVHRASAAAHESASQAALSLAARTQIKAAADANRVFLLTALGRLEKRLEGVPDSAPQLPSAAVQLRRSVEQGLHDFPSQYAAYEKLSAAVAALSAQSRAKLKAAARGGEEALKKSIQAEIEAAKADLEAAVFRPSDAVLRDSLRAKLAEVEELLHAQPRMAEQGLTLLQGRLARELTLAAQRQAEEQQRLRERGASLRELVGEISSHSQAVLKTTAPTGEVLQSRAELQDRPELALWRERAGTHLRRLTQLVAGELPEDLEPLRGLARESSELFEEVHQKLQEIATQTYLESQIAEVLGELGYQVSHLESDSTAGDHKLLATVSSQIGVEIHAGGQGLLTSEMVAFSENATEIDEAAQQKVCNLMDDVFDALRRRGHDLKEKKRRHSKRGRDKLRVIKAPATAAASPSLAAPLQRRVGE